MGPKKKQWLLGARVDVCEMFACLDGNLLPSRGFLGAGCRYLDMNQDICRIITYIHLRISMGLL